MDPSILHQYEAQASKVRTAIAGLTREDLLAFPVAGTWSIQQIVLHIADSEGVFADRIKRVLAEDNATLLAFDENRWSQNLHYNEQSADDAAAMIQLIRRQLTRVFIALPDTAFDRQGIHSQAGLLKLSQLIEKAVGHLDHHLKFIVEKRIKLGK